MADGFACKFCDNRTINKRSIIRHVTKLHESTRLRMGVKKVALYEPVYLQSWTRNPAEGRYWSVEKNGSGTQPAGDAETYVHLGGVFVREQRRIESLGAGQEAAATVTAGRSTFSELRPWLERTGWEQTYADVNRNLLRSLTIAPLFRSFPTKRLSLGNSGSGVGRARLDEDVVSPADDERKLAAISAAIDRVMERCEQTARTTGRTMLCWLQSARPYASYTKPFRFVARASTRKSYFGLLKRFMAMVFRAYRLSAHLRQRATGIRFKKAQLKSIAAIWNHSVWDQDGATTFDFWRPTKGCDMSGSRVDGKEGDECEDSASEQDDECKDFASEQDDDDHDDDNDDGTEDDSLDDNRPDGEWDDEDAESEDDEIAADPRAALIDEVLELLFGLMIQFSTEEIMDGRPASALLVYFSGVLGFSTDCAGFLPARSYTSHLAGLIYVQRLLFLEFALPAREYPLLGVAQRPRTNQVARLQVVRQKYSVLGAQSPFEEFFSLMAYGRAMAASETPAFLLRWSDDGQVVSHGDALTLSMECFRTLPDTLLAEADRLCTELMYDWQPPVELKFVKDSLANTSHGFSFMSDPQNGLSEGHLALSLKACTSQSNRLSRSGGWDWGAVTVYFKQEEAFRECLAGLMLVTGGGLPRGPDLLHLRWRNHMATERGIYVYDGSVI